MEWRGGAVAWMVATCVLAAGCQGVSIQKVRGKHGHSPTPAGLDAPPPPPRGFAPPPVDGPNPSDPDALLARASMSYHAGLTAAETSTDLAALYQLDAVVDASGALSGLDSGPPGWSDDPRTARARSLSGAAQEEFLRVTSGRRVRLDQQWRDELAARGIPLTIVQDGKFLSPDWYDKFLFADDFAIKNLDHIYQYDGVGVPLLAIRKFNIWRLEARQGAEKFLMPRQVYPLTALVKVVPPPPDRPGDPFGLRLELHDPLIERRVEVDGRSEPLAADLTTPLVYHFVQSPLPVLQEIGLLNPQWLEKLEGLYMIHPYEPGKIPVVLVHGLRSTPAVWMKVINDLRADPALRDRYQFWLFMYPSGSPFPDSAAKLRKGLNEIREAIDPGHADEALDRMVLVGHSMGGLISKMMIESSGEDLWKLVGRRPFDELQASPERKEALRQLFFFEPQASVARVVFIATPHRGSELGDQFIGRLTDRLIRLPSTLRSTFREIRTLNGPDFFTPEIRRGGLPSSIDELRPDNPLLRTLTRLPIKPGVEIHSIIGQKDPDVPIVEGSDGVVPYRSSHLDWARSELVVPGNHMCQDTPETIRELRRILYLHLGRVALESGAPLDDEVRRTRPGLAGSSELPERRGLPGRPVRR